MAGEKPPFFSFENGYLRVAGECGRAEYLEKLDLYHASGKLPVTGWPNGRGERRGIPPGDYRFVFGTGGRNAMAIRKDLASKWLHGPMPWQLLAGANPSGDWRTPPPRSTPARRLLAEGDTEIDQRAYRAIMRECRLAKPGDAPLAFTNLQLGGKEFIKLFRIRKAPGTTPAGARVLTAAAPRKKYDTEKRKTAEAVLKQVFPEGRPEDMPQAEFLRIVHGSKAFLSLSKKKQPSETTFRRAGGYRA